LLVNRAIEVLCFILLIQAALSWGQSGSVIQAGEEWLQPKDFVNYSYNDVSAVCPGGVCSGNLPGSAFDLTRYHWASSGDVYTLFNDYQKAGRAILADFAYINTDLGTHTLDAIVSDPPYEGAESDRISSAVILGGSVPDATEEIVHIGHSRYSPSDSDGGLGVWFWRLVTTDFIVHLEEPTNAETHSGIGNLRGWAIAEDGIDRVEIYIDGRYMYDAPYGGSRGDVGNDYPEIAGSKESGFSLAFGYSNLGFGEHTITARAFNTLGEYTESAAIFNVVTFDKKFIPETDVVDTSQAEITSNGDEILLENVPIGGRIYDLRLKWRTAEQGFEIIEIR
jgi:hypothetical protein